MSPRRYIILIENQIESYPEKLDVIENLIIESEVIAGDEINAGIFLDLPVLQSKTLALREEIIPREFATPVGFSGLLQVA